MYSNNIVLIDNLENSRGAVKVILHLKHFNTLLHLHISESKDSRFMNRSDLKLVILVN